MKNVESLIFKALTPMEPTSLNSLTSCSSTSALPFPSIMEEFQKPTVGDAVLLFQICHSPPGVAGPCWQSSPYVISRHCLWLN